MKIDILLTTVVQHPLGPYPVRGVSGKVHGYAREGLVSNRHALAIPLEDWQDGVGLDIMQCCVDPVTQWVPYVRVSEEEGDELSQKEKALQAQVDALQTEISKRDETVPVSTEPSPTESLPGEPPKTLDEAAVAVLRAGRNLPALEEDRVEQDPETGEMVKVHREIAPSVSGSPIESKSADGATGKETTRVPVTAAIDIVEEREKIEPPSDEPSKLADQVTAAAGNAEVPNQDAAEQNATKAQADAETDPNEKGGEQNLDEIGKQPSGFRKLRSIAKAEGVADFETITKTPDLVAAIQLHRESNPPSQS